MTADLALLSATAVFLAGALVLLGFVAHGADTVPSRLVRFMAVVTLVAAWVVMAAAFGVIVS